MREATLKEVLVISSAKKPPKLESKAEARIAVGAGESAKFEKQDSKKEQERQK